MLFTKSRWRILNIYFARLHTVLSRVVEQSSFTLFCQHGNVCLCVLYFCACLLVSLRSKVNFFCNGLCTDGRNRCTIVICTTCQLSISKEMFGPLVQVTSISVWLASPKRYLTLQTVAYKGSENELDATGKIQEFKRFTFKSGTFPSVCPGKRDRERPFSI